MKLHWNPASPFARKCLVCAAEAGVELDLITRSGTALMTSNMPLEHNPLGKIPALEDGGANYYDSRVIMEYLDDKAGGGKIIPASGPARYEALTRAALMDGILDAAVLVIYERRMRPEDKYVESVVERQRGKIIRGLEVIAAKKPRYSNGAMPDIGEIGLACVLDYLDFRKQVNWRDHAPNLASWLADFAAAVPGYEDSMPPND